MKKFFTLICALVASASAMFAAKIDDVAVCRHSYVLVLDEVTGAASPVKPGKGNLFGDGFFLDVTGGSVATNKGKSNPCAVVEEKDEEGNVISSTYKYGEAFAKKYASYEGEHVNTFRLKNAQDVIAMKVTAKSKIIFLGQVHASRYPKIAKDAALTEGVQTLDVNTTSENGYSEWTAPDDMTIYIGSQGGDWYLGMLIVEANEAPGTPSVKVGTQTYENGLWYREVICTPGLDEAGGTTLVTYTTDGSTPTAASPLYTAPIKCYAEQTVKFQAFMDFGDGAAYDEAICVGADNEGIVSFLFNVPSFEVDGANVYVVSEYEGAKNYVSYLDQADVETSSITLTESATVTAYSKIQNGSYATFTTKNVAKDVYVLNPIKEKKVITVSGNAIVDEEATATSTTGTVYKIENGAITAEKADFFVKNLEFAALSNDAAVAKYQVPAGQEAYIKMNATNITFVVAEGDSVDVKVTCSLNACKTLNEENDESVTTDRKCYVNVSGKTYGTDDITVEGGNIITFGLTAGTYTFQKYSGTGNILISSIEITPAVEAPAEAEIALVEGHTLLIKDLEAAGATDNSIVTFYIKNEAGESREGWGIGGFANSDNWTPVVNWSGKAGDSWTQEHSFAEIKQVAGDTPGEWHAIGITINIYNKCKVEKVVLTNGASSITSVEAEAAEAPAYNLMGQKTAATRGLMIRGGKIILVR